MIQKMFEESQRRTEAMEISFAEMKDSFSNMKEELKYSREDVLRLEEEFKHSREDVLRLEEELKHSREEQAKQNELLSLQFDSLARSIPDIITTTIRCSLGTPTKGSGARTSP